MERKWLNIHPFLLKKKNDSSVSTDLPSWRDITFSKQIRILLRLCRRLGTQCRLRLVIQEGNTILSCQKSGFNPKGGGKLTNQARPKCTISNLPASRSWPRFSSSNRPKTSLLSLLSSLRIIPLCTHRSRTKTTVLWTFQIKATPWSSPRAQKTRLRKLAQSGQRKSQRFWKKSSSQIRQIRCCYRSMQRKRKGRRRFPLQVHEK